MRNLSVNTYINGQLYRVGGIAYYRAGQSIQVNEMPEASASLINRVYQYIGATTENYTHGFFYECVLENGTYSWQILDTNPEMESISNSNLANMWASGGGSSVNVEPLSVINNGIYNAPSGSAYNPVTVNIPDRVQINPFPSGATTVSLYASESVTVTSSSIASDGTANINITETQSQTTGFEGMVIELNATENHMYFVEFDYQNTDAQYWEYPTYAIGWRIGNAVDTSWTDWQSWPNNIVRDSSVHHYDGYIMATGDKIYLNFNLCGYSDNYTNTAQITNLKVYDYSAGAASGILEPLTIETNGIYYPPTGANGISQVTVNIENGIKVFSKSAWDAMTTEQKRTYGLVAIQEESSGYKRGVLVNGLDYIPSSDYIPYTEVTNILCEAHVDNFDASENSWGDGTIPAVYDDNTKKPSLDTSANAISVNANNGVVPYVDLGADSAAFTAYVVMKAVSPSTYTCLVCSMDEMSSSHGITLIGTSIYIASFQNDTQTDVSSSNYFVGCIKFNNGNAKGYVYDEINDIIVEVSKTPPATGRYITLGKFSPTLSNGDEGNLLVKYFAVVNRAESDDIIRNNIHELYTTFIDNV